MNIKTYDKLVDLGIPYHMKGFKYILDAIEMITEKGEIEYFNAGELFKKIAEKENSTVVRVERCARTCLYKATNPNLPNSLKKFIYQVAFEIISENK